MQYLTQLYPESFVQWQAGRSKVLGKLFVNNVGIFMPFINVHPHL